MNWEGKCDPAECGRAARKTVRGTQSDQSVAVNVQVIHDLDNNLAISNFIWK